MPGNSSFNKSSYAGPVTKSRILGLNILTSEAINLRLVQNSNTLFGTRPALPAFPMRLRLLQMKLRIGPPD
jgi:hypothetical protein